MWNLKKAEEVGDAPAQSSGKSSPFMNPYELTKLELVAKLKFFGVFLASIVVLPKVLRSFGLLENITVVPLTRS